METGTDLSFTVNTHIKNNGFGLNTDFSVTDSRCDFRNLELSAKSEITLPDAVTSILNILGISSTITVADETMMVNFLPENATTLLSSQSFDISSLADPTVQSLLGIVGADATFTLKNVKFMTTG